MASMALPSFPFLENLPLWNTKGIMCCIVLHVGISEPLYYWFHRLSHTQYFFSHYHSVHHASIVTQPFTGKYIYINKIIIYEIISSLVFKLLLKNAIHIRFLPLIEVKWGSLLDVERTTVSNS